MNKIELFYIGDQFYSKSYTFMSSIYKIDTYERYDWGFVQIDLQNGKEVYIRPATNEEMKWAKQILANIILERNI